MKGNIRVMVRNIGDWRLYLEARRNTGGAVGVGYQKAVRGCLDRRRMVTAQVSFVTDKDERFLEKVVFSVDDFARGVSRERFDLPFFGAERVGITGADVKQEARGQPAVYRIMIRPLDDVMSLAFVRAYMARIEDELGRRLSWVAAIHDKETAANPESRHAHILIMGRCRDGKRLLLGKEFKMHGFREIAEALATELLGPMSDDEVITARERALRNVARNMALKRTSNRGWAIRRKK